MRERQFDKKDDQMNYCFIGAQLIFITVNAGVVVSILVYCLMITDPGVDGLKG